MTPRYSIKALLGLTAAFCVSLVLTRYNAAVAGAVMVGYVLVVAILAKGTHSKRALIYGPLNGIVLFIAGAVVVSTVRGELPQQPHTALSFARHFAFPIGGFVGGVGGLLYAGARSNKLDY